MKADRASHDNHGHGYSCIQARDMTAWCLAGTSASELDNPGSDPSYTTSWAVWLRDLLSSSVEWAEDLLHWVVMGVHGNVHKVPYMDLEYNKCSLHGGFQNTTKARQ